MNNRPECCGKPMYSRGHKAESGRQRYRCGKCRSSTTGSGESSIAIGYDAQLAAGHCDSIKKKIKNGLNRFVVTCAQDTTGKNAKFFASLLKYCEHNGAELLIIPVHYKNISLYTAGQEYKKSWNRDLLPYIIDRDIDLGGNIRVMASIKINATAANPLAGKESIAGTKWTIFGHAQVAMEPVASPANKMPKRMYTTGSVTLENYSQTNDGAKAKFHHTNGALIVETYGNKAFVRQLNADHKGGFYDLLKYYSPHKVTDGHRLLALTPGDGHEKFMSRAVRLATYDGEYNMLDTLKPEYLFHHDLLDGYAGSHHHESDPVLQFKKHHNGDNDYRAEIDNVVSFIDRTSRQETQTCIVPSNHHDHLYKFLSRADANKDHQNAIFIAEMQQLMREAVMRGENHDPFELYVKQRIDNVVFLDRSIPFVLKGVDYSQHGDVGVNGSRGSAAALAKSVYKMIIGHSHSARIKKGVYQVGKSSGRHEYEKGLGMSSNTHAIQYQNGKRALVDIINGHWCLDNLLEARKAA